MGEKAANPVVWFEIYVDDMDRARTFYETVLDVQLSQLPNPELLMFTFPMKDECGGCSGALAHHPEVKAGGMATTVYFSCEDCSVEESRVADAGGELVRSKMSIGEFGYVSLARDTEGNMIGLHSFS